MSEQQSALRDRLVEAGVKGLAIGAVVGLVLLGNLVLIGNFVFVPVLTMLAGGVIALVREARQAEERAPVSELLYLVFQGHPVPVREAPTYAVSRDGTSSVSYRALRAAGPRPVARHREPMVVPTGPPPPRPDGVDPIDLNRADVEELVKLPGVGAAAAARIVAHRDLHGDFPSLQALGAIYGFDQVRINYLREWATLEPSGLTSPDGDSPTPAAPEAAPAGEPAV